MKFKDQEFATTFAELVGILLESGINEIGFYADDCFCCNRVGDAICWKGHGNIERRDQFRTLLKELGSGVGNVRNFLKNIVQPQIEFNFKDDETLASIGFSHEGEIIKASVCREIL